MFLRYEQEVLAPAVQEFNSLRSSNSEALKQLKPLNSEALKPRVLIYRFPNLFGKWCRPNYNSAVATFCNAFANDLPYTVNDPTVELELLYIDDLVDEMIACLCPHPSSPSRGGEHRCEFNGLEVVPKEDGTYCYVPTTYKVTLGQIVDLLKQFKANGTTQIPFKEITLPLEGGVGEGQLFAKKLYSTYLSYLPKEKVAFPLKMNVDDRGSFTELVHTLNCGQVSINISKPGITKGQHWHNTKWEFFIVVSGHGLIQERKIDSPLPTSPSREGAKSPLEGEKQRGLWDTADPALYEQLKEHAEDMRKNPTEAESAMWEMLRGKNLDAKFRRQHIIGDYIVDFVCLDKQLVIELDGGYHNDPEQQELDRQRTNFLQSKGFSVLRFTNEEVLGNTDETLTVISNALKYLPLGSSPLEGETERGLVGCWFVSGNLIQAVHMLPGYTHNIINLSQTQDLVTVMYCNEIFDASHPDTYFEKV